MSSLARRSLRTTAAAAGIAALGLGFAGQALAAPAMPGVDGFGETGLPATPAMPTLPSQDGVSEEGVFMPGVANIEKPAVNTAAPALPAGDGFAMPTAPEFAMPAAPAAPESDSLPEMSGMPSTDGVDAEGDVGQDVDPFTDTPGNNQVGAMAAMDMARLMMDVAQDAAAGDPVAQNRQIG